MEEGPLHRTTLEICCPLQSSLLVVSQCLHSAFPSRTRKRRGTKHSRGKCDSLHYSEFIPSCALFRTNFRNRVTSEAFLMRSSLASDACCVRRGWRRLSKDFLLCSLWLISHCGCREGARTWFARWLQHLYAWRKCYTNTWMSHEAAVPDQTGLLATGNGLRSF